MNEVLASPLAVVLLTGLLFVGLSLHVRFIATSLAYRNLARGSLIGLVLVLVQSLVVLVRQPATWTGIELCVVSVFYLVGVGGYQLSRVLRARTRLPRVSVVRSGLGYLLACAGFIGGFSLYVDRGPGMYLVALVAVAIVAWNLLNAWSLLLGVADDYLVGAERGASDL